jgi:hypothetical protein
MTRRTTVPRLVRGSVINHRRRCGGANCRCTDGVSLHESTVLSYSEEGRTRFLMLPPEFVEPVRAATDRYRAARGGLEDRANAGLAALTATIAAAKAKA